LEIVGKMQQHASSAAELLLNSRLLSKWLL